MISLPLAAQNRDPAAAEALFRQGRSLMKAGQYAEACAKFQASQDLDPGVGTLLNIGECHEKAGHPARAWAAYQQARDDAHRAGDRAREKLAGQRADALASKLSTLTIEIAPDAKVEGLAVRRDGVAVSEASWGVAIPVDPGTITITATAPGKKPWKKLVEVAASGAVSVKIDALETETAEPAGQTESQPVEAPEVKLETAPEPRKSSAQKTIGFVMMGAGVVGLGVGGFFGLRASSKWSDAKGHCTNGTSGCDAAGLDLGDQAKSSADISSVAFIAGGVVLASGVVLWLTAPSSHPETSARVGVSPQGLGVSVHGVY